MGVLSFPPDSRQPIIPDDLQPAIQALVEPHVESFNFMLQEGLDKAVADLDAHEVYDGDTTLKLWVARVTLSKPMLPSSEAFSAERLVYPTEARQRQTTYSGTLSAHVMWEVGGEVFEDTQELGQVPVMVKSSACNLADKGPKAMVKALEEKNEMGGYFIINGFEKIIRMLILPRRHHIIAVNRKAFKTRGPTFTEWGCIMRCVRPDQTGETVTLHYMTNGTCSLRLRNRKSEFFVPAIIILKALVDTTDRDIFQRIRSEEGDTFVGSRVEAMLREALSENLVTKTQCLAYLGKMFGVVLNTPRSYTDIQKGEYLLDKKVFVHCQNNRDKFNLLILMIQKLYSLVMGTITTDNMDSPMMQEAMLPGHLYTAVLKESIDQYMSYVKTQINTTMQRNPGSSLRDPKVISKAFSTCPPVVTNNLEYFLATGNLRSSTGLDLQQATGFVVAADKLNYNRYLSHFRCIHRGAFFAQMKTTTVRKLRPEAWGFLCPVHTPDGAPCGLLNHLSHTCKLVNSIYDTTALGPVMAGLGMAPVDSGTVLPSAALPVVLDGTVMGSIREDNASLFCDKLRYLKATSTAGVPEVLEIALILPSKGGSFPGVYLFTSMARFIRPVLNLSTQDVELIGSLEQVYMNIAVVSSEVLDITTHVEIHPTNILSVVANATPFSDFNQSPRNMYQCQMGKQTMGTPMHSLLRRTDNAIYRLQTPQMPIVRTALYNHYELDEYPAGTNAVVAVISYTGYDMEDAMILNKGSSQRGFAYGTVYKGHTYDLTDAKRGRGKTHGDNQKVFGLGNDGWRHKPQLEDDGFAPIGTVLKKDVPLYAVYHEATERTQVVKYKDNEVAILDEVRILGSTNGKAPAVKAHVKFRFPRGPIIGDKFSSRHGQKGVCSRHWPMEDMPFTESGMQPDIIINPHAFPSRMTIGMLIESMAGKSGALHGLCHDATPFQFNETDTAIDYFGTQLTAAGYNYYGSERMYSGISGTELQVDIFVGVVYYQRLRHMVSDKFQVRRTGPVDPRTHQPVKGRKKGGGIRLGEMERDSLLAHGTAMMLHDRLFNCSDASVAHVCTTCGSILAPTADFDPKLTRKEEWVCRVCNNSHSVETVGLPYVLRYLASELLAMNIRLQVEIK